ncbi:hypothetical protein AK88_04328 [Plasmodium fragile]|uniref:Plasmodium RESA N-terminal domain-containing protein n=1 Tax=Plasmodium fragile TaxID=5857 RepID=A0A0D9QGQ0_PLAFR|nr:uncharacterized protein AK88_04328 [Plasmodium fragile]KJP85997.1 hypothetical protein AK88_04328 [Plasmodium fragile]
MNFQRSRLYRDVVLSLFVLLFVIILSDIYILKSSTSPWRTYTRFHDSRSRQLSIFPYDLDRIGDQKFKTREEKEAYEYLLNMVETKMLNDEKKRRSRDVSRAYSMPYRFDEEDVDRKLSKKELKRLMRSFGPLISEHDMYTTFYYYHDYLQRRFAQMLVKLEKLTYELGSKRTIPDEDLNVLWLDCKRKLSRFLWVLNHQALKIFFEFARDAPFEDTARFKKFMSNFVNKWKKHTREKSKKWVGDMTKEIKKYKRRSLFQW